MRGASRESLAAAVERLDALLEAGALDATELARELFGVSDVLGSSAGLRRALTDPSRSGEAKADLLRGLFSSRVGAACLDLVSGCVRARWSQPADLTQTVEELGVDTLLWAAERANRLDTVEDELFRFARVVGGDDALREAFSRRTEGVDRKEHLVRRLLEGRTAPETLLLAVRAARNPRGARTEQALEQQVRLANRRRRQLVAEVSVATPLATAQGERLAASLGEIYGRPVRLAVRIDPAVVGGIRVRVGGEVIDGSLATRLERARRGLAG